MTIIFQPDLDVVQHINQLFPTEQSLAGLDDTMAELTCQVKTNFLYQRRNFLTKKLTGVHDRGRNERDGEGTDSCWWRRRRCPGGGADCDHSAFQVGASVILGVFFYLFIYSQIREIKNKAGESETMVSISPLFFSYLIVDF